MLTGTLTAALHAGVLEKLKGLVALVTRKLGDGIAVPAYGTHAAFLKTPKELIKERNLYAGDTVQHLAPAPRQPPLSAHSEPQV